MKKMIFSVVAFTATTAIAGAGEFCDPYCQNFAFASVDRLTLLTCPAHFVVKPERRDEYKFLLTLHYKDPNRGKLSNPARESLEKCDSLAYVYAKSELATKAYVTLTDEAKSRLRGKL